MIVKIYSQYGTLAAQVVWSWKYPLIFHACEDMYQVQTIINNNDVYLPVVCEGQTDIVLLNKKDILNIIQVDAPKYEIVNSVLYNINDASNVVFINDIVSSNKYTCCDGLLFVNSLMNRDGNYVLLGKLDIDNEPGLIILNKSCISRIQCVR